MSGCLSGFGPIACLCSQLAWSSVFVVLLVACFCLCGGSHVFVNVLVLFCD